MTPCPGDNMRTDTQCYFSLWIGSFCTVPLCPRASGITSICNNSCCALCVASWLCLPGSSTKPLGWGCAQESVGAVLAPWMWLLLLPGLGCSSLSVSLSNHCQSLSIVSPHLCGPRSPLCPACGCGKLTTEWLSLFIYLWWGLCLLFVFQLSTHDISISLLGWMSVMRVNLWILLFPFKLDLNSDEMYFLLCTCSNAHETL